jgi:CubicO group peptidase (beta-lactamase class C family)
MISLKMRLEMKIGSAKIGALLLVALLFSGCGLSSGRTSNPEEVGLSAKHLGLLDGIIKESVARKDFPGAVILVGRKGKIIVRKAYGESQWVPAPRPMETTMLFDLASLTKPIATATSIMILVEQGRVSLDEKVKDYVPDFAPYMDETGKAAEDARLWHLLTHTSGLLPYFPPEANAEAVEKAFGKSLSTEELVGRIARLQKTDPPGTAFHYSCLGYITLGYIVKKISGQNVAEFSAEHIFKPLGMKHTFYNPPEKFLASCVPTEVIKGKPLVGVVHDPLARLQGGISGNAGLFSTADDLAVFAQMMLEGGKRKEVRILSPLTVAKMTSIWPKAPFAGRGLGWEISSAQNTPGGDLFGPHAYGHTGFTGTSIWIDPDTGIFIVFLTNRVHPQDKTADSIAAMRSRVANVVASSLEDNVIPRSPSR